MADTMTMSKILHVRENEKKVAQKDYYQSMDSFEVLASEFYTLLKKKEDAEATYEQYIHTTVPINEMMHLSSYIDSLNHQIIELQQRVNQARNDMELKQSKLSDAHIEVKKFENIIEHRTRIDVLQREKTEKAFMDEISMNQYISHNR